MTLSTIHVTVDAVIFGSSQNESTKLLLVKRKNPPFQGQWALPGGFLEEHETLAAAASRELEEETGVRLTGLEQLYAFGDPGRDPRGPTVSIAFVGHMILSEYRPKAGSDADEVSWFDTDDLPELAFDHEKIIQLAKKQVPDQ